MKKMIKTNWVFIITILFLELTPFIALSQTSDYQKKVEDNAIINPRFMNFIDSARTYIKKNNTLALSFYLRAFAEEMPQNPVYIYESASVSAKLGKKDLAFFLLNLSVEKKFPYYEHASKDESFLKLDPEKFNKCLDKIRETDSIYTRISAQLDAIYDRDQGIRERYYSELHKRNDKDSPEIKAVLDSMVIIDRENLAAVNDLIEKHGFLGNNLKSVNSRVTMFAVIQHAPTEAKERLLTTLQHALKNGELQPGMFAYIEDRMLADREKVQKYGTQYMVKEGEIIVSPPLINPEMVDIYRKSVGLNPLKEYIDSVKELEIPK